MNIYIPSPSMKSLLNGMWKHLKGSWVAPYLSHQAQSLSALHLLKRFPEQVGHILARGWFDRPLRGAAQGWESRYPLPYDPTATIDVDLTGTNAAAMIVADYCSVLEIGCGITVATTVAVLSMDFNLYSTMADNAGTATSKLDGTNGNITEGSVALLGISDVLYKDIGHTIGPIDVDKGYSINAIVLATASSAGQGVPYVLVIPRAESNLNVATMVASA